MYVNVSGIPSWSCLSSQILTILAPWVLFLVEWFMGLVPPWVTASCFLAGNSEAELIHTTFSSLLLFRGFLSFLFSWAPFEGCLLGLLLNITTILRSNLSRQHSTVLYCLGFRRKERQEIMDKKEWRETKLQNKQKLKVLRIRGDRHKRGFVNC